MRRFTHIYDRLYENYGPQGWWPLLKEDQDGLRCRYEPENSIKELNRQEQFEICVGAILTQNTNWNNAERALVSLAKSGNLDPNSLASMEPESISEHIKSSGYYNQKAKKLKEFASFSWATRLGPEAVSGTMGARARNRRRHAAICLQPAHICHRCLHHPALFETRAVRRRDCLPRPANQDHGPYKQRCPYIQGVSCPYSQAREGALRQETSMHGMSA